MELPHWHIRQMKRISNQAEESKAMKMLLELKQACPLENPIPHLLFWFAHPFRRVVWLVAVLTPPLLGWLRPKGQVTRAQEAEENYLVKRELTTVKQQSEEASAQLEQAKNTIWQLQQQQQQPQAVRRAAESPTGPDPTRSVTGSVCLFVLCSLKHQADHCEII